MADLQTIMSSAPSSGPDDAPPPSPAGTSKLDQFNATTQAGIAGALPEPPPPPAPDNIGAQLNKGLGSTIADVAGFPGDFGVDANAAAMNVGQWAKSKLTGQPADYSKQPYVPDWYPTSDHIKSWMSDLGVPTTESTPAPTTLPGKIAAGAGNNIAGLAQMYMGGKALLATGIEDAMPVVGKAIRTLTESLTPSVANTAIGAGAGASGAAAEELAPDKWKPEANLAGQLLGGGTMAAGTALLSKAAGVAAPILGDMIGPIAKGQQMRAAGTAIRNAATDKGMTAANIESGAEPTVPGSQPTIGMASNDPGLMQLERTTAQKNPGAYQDRTAQNNVARVEAMQGLAPENANPQAAKDFFKSQYDATDAATAQAEAAAKAEAQAKLDLVNGVGTPEQYGAAVRNQLLAQKNAEKASASNLWQAVDPDGKATVDITPVKTASYQLRSAMPSVAKPMGGEEKAIFDAVDGLPQVTPFSDLQALDSRIGSEIRTVRGTPGGDLQSLRRLQILKDGIRDTMAGFVENQGGHDAAAVQAGAMAPADTIFSRLQSLSSESPSGATASAREVGAGPASGAPDAGETSLRTGTATPAYGEAVPAGGVAGGATRTSGIPQAAPTADQGLAQRYGAAKAATLSLKQKFSQGPIGSVLQPGPRGAPFSVMDSAVGDRLFTPGPKGGQTIAAYQKAGGDLSKLQDYITWNLRNSAVKSGSIDSAAYDRWATKYKTALDALPSDVKAPFQDAATAQKTVDTAEATRVSTMRDLQDSELKAWLKDQDPKAAVGQTIGDPGKFGQLVARAKTAPSSDILDSLKRNTIDYMLGKTQGGVLGVGTDEGLLKGDALRKFVDGNRQSLAKLFTPEQMNVLDNVVSDIQRQNQVASSSKLPFGSNTTQDTHAMGGDESTVFDHIAKEIVGATIGGLTGGPAGAIGGGIMGKIAGRLGTKGAAKIQDLITQAVLDPKFGVVLLNKVGAAKPSPFIMNTLRARLSAYAANAGTQYESNKKAVGQ